MAIRHIVVKILTIVLPSLFFILPVEASEVYVRNETIGILGEGLDAIKSVSSQGEKSIIDKIDIDVPIDPAPVRVRAFKKSGVRKIEVSTGYSAISRMIVTGYIMELKLGIKNFGEDYARYTANTYATGRLGGGEAPWEKAKLSSKEQQALFKDKDFNAIQHGQHMIVLWYVLAHEIAHHVLDHAIEDGMKLSDIREQEKEADTWASNIFIKIGIPPAAAFPANMYWYYLDEYGLKDEYRKTHPPDLKRTRWMLQKTINRFDEWNSKEKYFPAVPKEKTVNAYKRLLYYI